MPYINRINRAGLVSGRDEPIDPGELNFKITSVITTYLGKSPNYERFNDAIGALEAAKLELYRRAVAPYEDTKIATNGDVY